LLEFDAGFVAVEAVPAPEDAAAEDMIAVLCNILLLSCRVFLVLRRNET